MVALHALLRERNVTRAAKSVGLGQSSMSHALARLRAHLGDPLLAPPPSAQWSARAHADGGHRWLREAIARGAAAG